tara:strand:+ start:263 stop:676 length:414 start_codon:yes stop_codon:yes gene_type:complete
MEKKNGYIDMVGDLFHYGHVRQIKEIFDQGYNVIVGVHSDKTAESYKRKPILNMNERIEVIESCKYVSLVIPEAPLILTDEYINTHKIDMVFHGHTKEEEDKYNYMYSCAVKLGKFTRTDYTDNISTTDIINRIKNY